MSHCFVSSWTYTANFLDKGVFATDAFFFSPRKQKLWSPVSNWWSEKCVFASFVTYRGNVDNRYELNPSHHHHKYCLFLVSYPPFRTNYMEIRSQVFSVTFWRDEQINKDEIILFAVGGGEKQDSVSTDTLFIWMAIVLHIIVHRIPLLMSVLLNANAAEFQK